MESVALVGLADWRIGGLVDRRAFRGRSHLGAGFTTRLNTFGSVWIPLAFFRFELYPREPIPSYPKVANGIQFVFNCCTGVLGSVVRFVHV